MQLPTGGAPAISPASENTTAPLRAPEKGPEKSRLWMLILLAIILAAAAGLYLYRQRAQQAEQSRIARSAFRTTRVASGVVVRTLRLSGVTAAERYVSLLTPQLHGRRGGGGGGGGSSSTAVQMPTAVQSNSGTSSASTSSSSSSSSGNSAGIGASSGFSGKNAYQAATSRTGRSSSSTSSSSSSQTASTGDGAASLGSTAGNLLRVGGGGGGGFDFNLTLLNLVKPGSIVKSGETVAEFDRQYMLLRLDDYRAAVLQDENALKSLKAQLEVTTKAHEQTIRSARADVDKAKLDIKTIPVRSAIDSEKLRLALEEAEARYRQVLAEVKFVKASQLAQIRDREIELQQTTIEYKRAMANAEKMVVKAPIGGLTVMQSMWRGGEMAQIQVGDQLWPGMMFMQIVDNQSMVINATINQVDIESVRLGQKAMIHFDAYPDLTLPARVISIGAMTKTGGMRASYVKSVPIRLKLDHVEPRVIPDLTVSADIEIQTAEAKTAVPLEAIFRDGQDQKPYVYVRDGETAWRRREVEVGLASNILATVRSGLEPGELVALERPAESNSPPKDTPAGKSTKE